MKKIFQIILVGLGIVCSHTVFAQSNQIIPVPAPIQVEMHGKANNNLQTATYENIGEQKAKPSPSNFDAPPCVSCQHEIQDYQKQLDGVRKDMARYDQATQAKFTSVIAELEARIAETNAKMKLPNLDQNGNEEKLLKTEEKLETKQKTPAPTNLPTLSAD